MNSLYFAIVETRLIASLLLALHSTIGIASLLLALHSTIGITFLPLTSCLYHLHCISQRQCGFSFADFQLQSFINRA